MPDFINRETSIPPERVTNTIAFFREEGGEPKFRARFSRLKSSGTTYRGSFDPTSRRTVSRRNLVVSWLRWKRVEKARRNLSFLLDFVFFTIYTNCCRNLVSTGWWWFSNEGSRKKSVKEEKAQRALPLLFSRPPMCLHARPWDPRNPLPSFRNDDMKGVLMWGFNYGAPIKTLPLSLCLFNFCFCPFPSIFTYPTLILIPSVLVRLYPQMRDVARDGRVKLFLNKTLDPLIINVLLTQFARWLRCTTKDNK